MYLNHARRRESEIQCWPPGDSHGEILASSIGSHGFAIPVSQLAVIVVVGAIAGVLAAVRPARRAARLDVLNAIKVS